VHLRTQGTLLPWQYYQARFAAERGVRVRLLLDDNGISGLDNVLADLNGMEDVEIRIFNPFTMRSPKLLSNAVDFFRLNRRMHNKSMTVTSTPR